MSHTTQGPITHEEIERRGFDEESVQLFYNRPPEDLDYDDVHDVQALVTPCFEEEAKHLKHGLAELIAVFPFAYFELVMALEKTDGSGVKYYRCIYRRDWPYCLEAHETIKQKMDADIKAGLVKPYSSYKEDA